MTDDEIPVFKIPILGRLQVGKSAFFSRIVHGRITPKASPPQDTIVNFLTDYRPIIPKGVRFEEPGDDVLFKLVFFDDPECLASTDNLAGYICDAAVVLILFDVTDRETAIELLDLAAQLNLAGLRETTQSWLVGNKIDLRDAFVGSPIDESISPEEGSELAVKIGCACYSEVSALTGEGIDALLSDLSRFLMTGL